MVNALSGVIKCYKTNTWMIVILQVNMAVVNEKLDFFKSPSFYENFAKNEIL